MTTTTILTMTTTMTTTRGCHSRACCVAHRGHLSQDRSSHCEWGEGEWTDRQTDQRESTTTLPSLAHLLLCLCPWSLQQVQALLLREMCIRALLEEQQVRRPRAPTRLPLLLTAADLTCLASVLWLSHSGVLCVSGRPTGSSTVQTRSWRSCRRNRLTRGEGADAGAGAAAQADAGEGEGEGDRDEAGEQGEDDDD